MRDRAWRRSRRKFVVERAIEMMLDWNWFYGEVHRPTAAKFADNMRKCSCTACKRYQGYNKRTHPFFARNQFKKEDFDDFFQ